MERARRERSGDEDGIPGFYLPSPVSNLPAPEGTISAPFLALPLYGSLCFQGFSWKRVPAGGTSLRVAPVIGTWKARKQTREWGQGNFVEAELNCPHSFVSPYQTVFLFSAFCFLLCLPRFTGRHASSRVGSRVRSSKHLDSIGASRVHGYRGGTVPSALRPLTALPPDFCFRTFRFVFRLIRPSTDPNRQQ
jgi:hypothetical protein